MTSCIYDARRRACESNYKGMLQVGCSWNLELGWLSVVESVDNEINTVVIANSQTNDNLQVMCSM